MEEIKRFGYLIKFYFGWIVYFHITLKERREYIQATTRGYDCLHSHDDSHVLPYSATMFYFDKSKAPKRRYLTFNEYKKQNFKTK